MAYDEMGNYTGYDESYSSPVSPYDFEEEDRKKEELKRQLEEQQRQADELASQVSNKQEVTEYGDGSRTVKTTKEIPAGPVSPDYNANIARQESGNRPDIGYHDPGKSSAYGMYGMTGAGYEDARRANPNLPADITQATPEQQTAAQDAYTQQNAKYLQAYGVEPNANTLAAAHFLGAKGLSDYLKTGQISEAAARANGGAENVKRIVDQRLGGQAAPASGAAQQPAQQPAPQMGPVSPEQAQQQDQQLQQQLQQFAPQAQPEQKTNSFDAFGKPIYSEQQAKLDKHVDNYTTNQNDPQALMKLSTDEGTPDWMKERSRNRAADIITQQRDMKDAQEKLASATPSDLAKYMREKTTGGSWIKAIFYAAIGAKQLAQEEGAKLGIGTEKIVTGSDGKAYMVKVSSNGTPLDGYSAETGKKLSSEELINAVGQGTNKKEVSTSAEQFQDKEGNIYRSQSDKQGNLVTKNIVTGEVYKGDPTKLTRVRDVATQTAAEQKQGFKRENDATGFANSIRKLDYDSKLKAVADFRQAAINRGEPDLSDSELSAMGVDRPDLGPARQQAGAQAPAPMPAQGQAPAAPIAPTPIAGQAPAPLAPVAPGTSVTGRITPEAMKRQEAETKLARERQEAEAKLTRESASAVNVDQQKRFNEYVEKDLQPKADAGKMISRVRKEQINGPDGILNNPEIAGLLSGSNGGEVGNIMRDLITGNFKDQADLSTRVAALNLTPRQKEVLYTQIGLNNQILPQTLKANAGPGAISEAEHKINREANVEITRQPLYSGLTLMTRDQFVKDVAVAKNDFRSANPNVRTTDDMNKAWAAQEKRANEAYDGIYAARANYIAKHNPNNTNPGAVVDAFKHYPVPTWNGNSWEYGTEFAKKAARKPLGSFKN
jgi:hypothetical protein